jgi:hypothetical protein
VVFSHVEPKLELVQLVQGWMTQRSRRATGSHQRALGRGYCPSISSKIPTCKGCPNSIQPATVGPQDAVDVWCQATALGHMRSDHANTQYQKAGIQILGCPRCMKRKKNRLSYLVTANCSYLTICSIRTCSMLCLIYDCVHEQNIYRCMFCF